jgi:hypothetical protein
MACRSTAAGERKQGRLGEETEMALFAAPEVICRGRFPSLPAGKSFCQLGANPLLPQKIVAV